MEEEWEEEKEEEGKGSTDLVRHGRFIFNRGSSIIMDVLGGAGFQGLSIHDRHSRQSLLTRYARSLDVVCKQAIHIYPFSFLCYQNIFSTPRFSCTVKISYRM